MPWSFFQHNHYHAFTSLTDASYLYDEAGRLAQESLAVDPYVMEFSGSGSQSTLSLQLDNTYGTEDGTLSATQLRATAQIVTPQGDLPQRPLGRMTFLTKEPN